MTMNVKQRWRTVIEFRLLEGYEGENIVLRLQNMSGLNAHRGASVFRRMNEIRPGKEELRNEERRADSIVTKRMRLFVQFCEMIRMPHCET
jgi:hypothetical protein